MKTYVAADGKKKWLQQTARLWSLKRRFRLCRRCRNFRQLFDDASLRSKILIRNHLKTRWREHWLICLPVFLKWYYKKCLSCSNIHRTVASVCTVEQSSSLRCSTIGYNKQLRLQCWWIATVWWIKWHIWQHSSKTSRAVPDLTFRNPIGVEFVLSNPAVAGAGFVIC